MYRYTVVHVRGCSSSATKARGQTSFFSSVFLTLLSKESSRGGGRYDEKPAEDFLMSFSELNGATQILEQALSNYYGRRRHKEFEMRLKKMSIHQLHLVNDDMNTCSGSFTHTNATKCHILPRTHILPTHH